MTADPFTKVPTSLLIRPAEFAAGRCKLGTGQTEAENFDVLMNVPLCPQRIS